MIRQSSTAVRLGVTALAAVTIAVSGGTLVGATRHRPALAPRSDTTAAETLLARVLLGRSLVLNHDCAGCHGGAYPSAPGWLAGWTAADPTQPFLIGPCAQNSGAKPCFRTRARNLTPDNATGLGRFSERQIFNALRYGLRPEETPDVPITSTAPGEGNFPLHPRYLAPPMPWPGWRYMSDQELWAIAAYLKHGVRPVHNRVPDSEGPPDFWASMYTVAAIGPYPPAPFPTQNEQRPHP